MEPCKILSLDGGGVRGTSALLILERLMEEVRSAHHLDQVPRPCEYFDLIGGTSTGGIIAIMLGRLGMTVDECIRAYKKVAMRAFTPKRNKLLPGSPSGMFSATELEAAIRKILREHCVESACIIERGAGRPTGQTCPHSEVRFRGLCTKTVVLAITKDNVDAPPTLFKTYDTFADFQDTTIWQVARATSAAMTFFKPIRVGRDEIEFIDAGFGYNNPCDVLIEEAHRLYPDRPLRTLSIGTGLGSVVSLGRTRLSIVDALNKMVTTSQKVALRLDKKYGNNSTEYFRFNVERGLDDVGLEDWTKSSKIAAHTKNYLQENVRKVEQFAQLFEVHEVQLSARKVSELQGAEPVSELPGTGKDCAFYSIPFRQNPDFTGRKDILGDLIRILFEDSQNHVALVGLGGIGKTQVALKLAYWIRENRKACSVVWLPASSPASFEKACREVVHRLGVTCDENQDPRESFKMFLESERAGQCVLIIDNADDARVLYGTAEKDQGIYDFLPLNGETKILVTTRSQKIAVDMAGSRVVELVEMGFDDTKLLFERMLMRKALLKDEQAVKELLGKLVFLPLAVAQVAYYININKISVAKYLQLFSSTDDDMICLLSSKIRDEYHYDHLQGAIATTWYVSFTQLSKEDPFAAHLLSYIAWMEPKSIPRSILPSPGSEAGLTNAIGVLRGYGFLNERDSDEVFDIHRLVHLAMRVWLDGQGSSAQTRHDAVTHLAAIVPPINYGNSHLWRSYLPHILRIYESGPDAEGTGWGVLGHWAGECLLADDRFTEALRVLEHKFAVEEATLDDGHEDLICSQKLLARAYLSCGRVTEAVWLLEHVLSIQLTVLPENQLDVLDSREVLAWAYLNNWQPRKAVRLLTGVVAKKEKMLVESDTGLLVSRQLLAWSYLDFGRVAEAIQLFEYTASIVEKTFAPDHPHLLNLRHLLSVAYTQDGQAQKAVQLLEDIVDKQRKASSETRRALLSSQTDLASAYLSNGQVKDAIRLMQLVVSLITKVYAEDHPYFFRSQYLLADAYQTDGQVKEAVSQLDQIESASETALAEDHPYRLSVQCMRAELYQRGGQVKEAICLLEQVVMMGEKVLAEKDPAQATHRCALASAYQADGRFKESMNHLEYVVAVRKGTMKNDDPRLLEPQRALCRAREHVK